MSRFSASKLSGFLLLLILICFWGWQWGALQNPYFWDEMGVYGYGVNYLVEHGISLYPIALPPEISRGHPLLFFSLYASAIKLFGHSLFVSHGLALFISSLTLIACYKLARLFTPPFVAVSAALLLLAQNIFLAQSTLVLPEMLVALLTCLAFLHYFQKQYFWTILWLCIGVMIKESVILTAGFFGFIYLLETLFSKETKSSFLTLLSFSLPLVVLVVFLLIQKQQNGWYFFPYHTDLISEGVLAGFKEKFENHLKFLFYRQGRMLWIPFLSFSILALLFSKFRKQFFILISFVSFSLIIFSLAFYMDRYLLYLYPIISALIVSGTYLFFKHSGFSYALVGLLIFMGIQSLDLNKATFNYDVDLSYRNVVSMHHNALSDFCTIVEETSSEEALIVYANFPINMSLWESYFGYANAACLANITLTDAPEKANFLILNSETLNNAEKVFIENKPPLKSYANNAGRINTYKAF